jgi:hypothetical protein
MTDEQEVSEKSKFDKILNYLLVGVFIIVVLIIFALVFLFQNEVTETFDMRWNNALEGKSGNNYYSYNGFPFARTDDGLWQTMVLQKFTENGQTYSRDVTLTMYFDPKSLEDISVEGDIFNILDKSLLYTSFKEFNNSMHAIAGIEFRKIVGGGSSLINIPTYTGIYGSNQSHYSLINCDNATSEIGVIEFRRGSVNAISEISNCIVLMGQTDEDLIRVADKYVYYLLGIIR